MTTFDERTRAWARLFTFQTNCFTIPFYSHWWLRTWRIYKFKFVYILTAICIPAYLRLFTAIFHTLFLITLFRSLFFSTKQFKKRIQSLSIFKSYLKLNRSIPKLYRENFIRNRTHLVVIYIQLLLYVQKKRIQQKTCGSVYLWCIFLWLFRDYLSSSFYGRIEMS